MILGLSSAAYPEHTHGHNASQAIPKKLII